MRKKITQENPLRFLLRFLLRLFYKFSNFFRMVGKAAVTHNLFLLRLQKALYRNTFLLYNKVIKRIPLWM